MADYDEYEREQALINQINQLIDENNSLAAELDTAIANIAVVVSNLEEMSRAVVSDVNTLSSNMGTVDENISIVKNELHYLTTKYFLFKNLSTASKNLSQLTDEYYTRFAHYNKLRRITLGYVVGLDNAIISSETLRKEVEKIYLQNTDYWLAYAISAVMLWASNEKEAALRAMRKSISMDATRSSVFFLLINLRFDRLDAAKDWYLDYLDKIDLMALGSEYQYLLQAYLAGLFGADPEFEEFVSDNFQKALVRIDALTVDYAKRVSDRAKQYAELFIHRTEQEFPTMLEISSDYEKLILLLSKAECNSLFALAYQELAYREEEYSEDQAQRIENVLYELISSYDDSEWKVVKQQKYNECIIEAQGDMVAAGKKFDSQYAVLDKKRSLADLIMDWAFSEDPTITNLVIKRFAVSLMKEPIARGFEQFAEGYRSQEPNTLHMEIDGFPIDSDENDFERQKSKLAEMYRKSRLKEATKDKYVKIFFVICAASVLLLALTAVSFNPISLTIGILGGIAGGFVLWRRLVEVGRNLEEKKRLGIQKLQNALSEIAAWRKLFREADSHAADVKEILEQF